MNAGSSWEQVEARRRERAHWAATEPPKPRRIRGALSWLWGIVVQLVFLVNGVAVIAASWDDKTADQFLVGVALLGLFVIANDWAHERGNN